ncbi:MAG TPA: 50S ribosomal protein L31 [Acidimicrobiia bacterium]|jgi:large subunit ribosomal protein L31|nr:50S ribosomal protein L31 [Acidimicrobiia bacterium]
MKTGIHPDYVLAQVHCSCGHTYVTRSTKPELRVDLCSECHPFYTGKQKVVDTAGRVERFQRRQAATAAVQKAQAAQKAAAAAKKAGPATKKK